MMKSWPDIAILIALAYFIYMGFRHGFLVGLLELVGIAVSIGVPFLLYIPGSRVLTRFGVSQVYAGALAFLIIWFIALNLYFFAARRLYRAVPRMIRASCANRVMGMLPGLARGVITVAVLLALMASLPTPLISQRVIERSVLAPPLVNAATELTSYAVDIFGGAIQNALGFLTIEPEADERVDLRFRVEDPTIDPEAETELFDLINAERRKRGMRPLTMDATIRRVARRHSADMFRRGYFAHVNLDGLTPFRRLHRGGAAFMAAGENIALAPTVEMAHRGLMNSPGHRANILRPSFQRVGIGAARGGRFGVMFTEDFAD